MYKPNKSFLQARFGPSANLCFKVILQQLRFWEGDRSLWDRADVWWAELSTPPEFLQEENAPLTEEGPISLAWFHRQGEQEGTLNESDCQYDRSWRQKSTWGFVSSPQWVKNHRQDSGLQTFHHDTKQEIHFTLYSMYVHIYFVLYTYPYGYRDIYLWDSLSLVCAVSSDTFNSVDVLKTLMINYYFITQWRGTTQLEKKWANNCH